MWFELQGREEIFTQAHLLWQVLRWVEYNSVGVVGYCFGHDHMSSFMLCHTPLLGTRLVLQRVVVVEEITHTESHFEFCCCSIVAGKVGLHMHYYFVKTKKVLCISYQYQSKVKLAERFFTLRWGALMTIMRILFFLHHIEINIIPFKIQISAVCHWYPTLEWSLQRVDVSMSPQDHHDS